MKAIIAICIPLIWALSSSFHFPQTIKLDYEPSQPRIYFYGNGVIIETDTIALMKLVRENYLPSRSDQIRTELIYRITTARDSVILDGWTMNLYTNAQRTAFEMNALNHSEVITLIKSGQVKMYDGPGLSIDKITIKRKGSKRRNSINDIYYDTGTGRQLFMINVYRRLITPKF